MLLYGPLSYTTPSVLLDSATATEYALGPLSITVTVSQLAPESSDRFSVIMVLELASAGFEKKREPPMSIRPAEHVGPTSS